MKETSNSFGIPEREWAQLVDDAARAEELLDADELERYAEERRAKRHRQDEDRPQQPPGT